MDPAPFRFAARGLAFLLLLAGVAAALDWSVPRSAWLARALHVERDFEMLATAEGTTVFFGDSVISWVPAEERGTPSLARLIQERAGEPLRALWEPGAAPDAFLARFRFMRQNDALPRAVIVALNLSSFSALIDSSSSLDVRWHMHRLGLYVPVRAAAVFKYTFGRPTPAEFLRMPVVIAGHTVGTLGELEARRKRGGFQENKRLLREMRYAADIRGSRQLASARQLLGELRESGLPCLVYLTPIDMESVIERDSAADAEATREDLRVLRELVSDSGHPWLDLSEAVPAAQFEYLARPHSSEHLRLGGRVAVSEQVAALLERVLAPGD